MSTEEVEKVAKIFKEKLSNAQPELYLAKVDSLQPDKFTASISFFYPKDKEDTSLNNVRILRRGAGFMPAVGDEVAVGFAGIEHPIILGVYKDGSWAGMVSGKEWTLGDGENVFVKDDKTIVLQNNGGNIEIDPAGLVTFGNNAVALKELFNIIAQGFIALSTQPTPSPTAPLSPSSAQVGADLMAKANTLLK